MNARLLQRGYEMSERRGYEHDVVEHVLVGRARARMLEDLRVGKKWDVDLARGRLELGDTTHRIQVLGSCAEGSDSFVWAWANPEAGAWANSLERVSQLRAYGARPGYSVFAQGHFSSTRVNPYEVAYVSGELCDGAPVFVARQSGSVVFLLVTSLRLELEQLPLAYVPGIVMEISSITRADPKRCVRHFLAKLGASILDRGCFVNGVRSDGSINAKFDAAGRLADVFVSRLS